MHQKQPLKFSQLIYRTIAFFSIFLLSGFLLIHFSGIKKNEIVLSEIEISTTFLFNIFTLILIFFFYLIAFTKDNTLKKLWNVFKLRGAFGGTPETRIKWWTFLLIIIFGIYFAKPNLYLNINALKHTKIYEGKSFLSQNPKAVNKYDKRYVNVVIEKGDFEFQGRTNEIHNLLNRNISITIYQGIFTKYVLIKN